MPYAASDYDRVMGFSTLRRAAVRLIPTALVKPIAMAKASLEARLRK